MKTKVFGFIKCIIFCVFSSKIINGYFVLLNFSNVYGNNYVSNNPICL